MLFSTLVVETGLYGPTFVEKFIADRNWCRNQSIFFVLRPTKKGHQFDVPACFVITAVPKLCAAARLCQGRRESMRKLLYLLLFSQ